uniref:DNA double-strand break repair nuclease NurA n=1 Tax=Ignisphaera aggregans TaxID=334771 RepID=A0A7J3Z8Y3_9CREN
MESLEELLTREATGVAPEVVEKVLVRTASRLVKEVEKVRLRIAEIRRSVEARGDIFALRVVGDYERLCYAAVDSSFTAPAIELVGGYLGIIAVVKVLYGSRCGGGRRGSADAEVYTELWFNRDYVNEFAKYYERATALKLLEAKRGGGIHFDVLLLDGEIIPRVWRGSGNELLRVRAVEVTNRIIELADETDTAVAGVLKRSYSRDLVNILGFHDLRLSDRAVMSLALKPGEYLVAGSYSDLHRELEKLRGRPGVDDEWLKARLEWYEGILQNTPTGYEVKLAFYRAPKTLYPTATKVEYMTSSSLHEEALISSLVHISTATGLPAPVDEADRLAASTLTRELKQTVYQKLIAEVAKNTKVSAKEVLPLLSLMNPEKLHIVS